MTVTLADASKVSTPNISGATPFLTSTEVSINCGIDGATIYYSTDGGSSWSRYTAALTLSATTTLKAKAIKDGLTESDVAEVEFTKVTPISVTEALEVINSLENNGTIDGQCVIGKVSTAASSVSSGKMSYYISADGTATEQLQIYQGKGLNGADFTDKTDLEVGDEVVVYGQLKKYVSSKTTPEFNDGSYLLSLTEIQESDLTSTGDINLSMAAPSTTATATDYFTTSSTGIISYQSSDEAVATVDANGVVTPVAQGTTTITVSQAIDIPNYKAGEITINVIVAAATLNKTTIAANESGTTAYGNQIVEDYMIDNTYDGTVVATSSNTAVATVNIEQPTEGEGTFTITPKAVGTAVITLSAAGTATCEAADDVEYTITVTAPEGKATAASAAAFEKVTSDAEITDGQYLIVYEEGSVAFNGGLETLDAVGNTINVTMGNNTIAADDNTKAAAFTLQAVDKEYTIQSASGKYIGQNSNANGLASDENTAYTNTISINNDGEADIISSGGAYLRYNSASNQTRFRYFKSSSYTGQKAIQLYKLTGADLSVTIPTSGWGTFCCEYSLDLTTATLPEGITAAYTVTAVSGETVTLTEINGSVKGGTGIVLKGTAGTYTLASTASSNEPENELIGTLAPTYIAENAGYGLKEGVFQPSAGGTMKAGKAYLPASAVSGNVKALTLVINGADGIQRVETLNNPENIYNLAGQRVNRAQKGIFIVNGKKVVK